jgi:dephospho-CoA kinase
MQRDNITREAAIAWIEKQWPQSEIQKRANFEIINDGRELEPQIENIINHIKE